MQHSQKLLNIYPAFQHRPYTACWVKLQKLGKGVFGIRVNEDITLNPTAESTLFKK